MEENSITIPLYDRVKHQIYDDYQRLNRQSIEVLNCRNNYARHFAIRHFKGKFVKFSNQVVTLSNYHNVKAEIRNRIQGYREHLDTIKSFDDCDEVVLLCAAVIKVLGITRIAYTRDNEAF